MKRLLTLTLLSIALTTSNASILGASSYEDCILENMKNVSNSEVANQIASACRTKFPNKAAPSRSRNGIKECRLYWDGWKLVKGVKPSEAEDKEDCIITVMITNDCVQTIVRKGTNPDEIISQQSEIEDYEPGKQKLLDALFDYFFVPRMMRVNAPELFEALLKDYEAQERK